MHHRPAEEPPPPSVIALLPDRASAPAIVAWAAREAAVRAGGLLVVDAPLLEAGRAPRPPSGGGLVQWSTDGGWLERDLPSPAAPVVVERIDAEGSAALRAIRHIGRATGASVVATAPMSRSVLSGLIFGPGRHERQLPDAPAVVVVPSPPASSDSTAPVTVGFHGTEGSAVALRWAVEEAGYRSVSVVAVMAWSEHELDEVAGCIRVDPRRHSLPGRAAHRVMEVALSRARVPLNAITPVVRRGAPTQSLLQESGGASLLVVGAGDLLIHGYRVLGPIAGACANRSSTPVAIIPNP